MRRHDDPELLMVSEAAARLGITRQRVYVLIGKGVLVAVKGPGGHVFVTLASVKKREAWLSEWDGFLTTDEVAAIKGVTTKTVRRWHVAGHLKGRLAEDRRLRFDAAEVERFTPIPVGRPKGS